MGRMQFGHTYERSCASVDETKSLAASLAAHLRAGDVVVLSGDLGAGKTQFVQGVAAGLGITAPVTSPTFNLLLEYPGGRLPLYHFDLYRLEAEEELEDIGFYETLEGDGASFIEWGEKFPEALPDSRVDVCLGVEPDGARRVRVAGVGGRGAELARDWDGDATSGLVEVAD